MIAVDLATPLGIAWGHRIREIYLDIFVKYESFSPEDLSVPSAPAISRHRNCPRPPVTGRTIVGMRRAAVIAVPYAEKLARLKGKREGKSARCAVTNDHALRVVDVNAAYAPVCKSVDLVAAYIIFCLVVPPTFGKPIASAAGSSRTDRERERERERQREQQESHQAYSCITFPQHQHQPSIP